GGVPAIVSVRADYVQRLRESGEAVIFVDLRKAAEFAAGHLPGATSLLVSALESRHGEIPRSGRVVLYCDCPDEEIGSVYTFLRTRGYENHSILDGGYRGWL